MEYDLTQGLRDLSRTPPVGALPPEPVVRRVRRGRSIRAAAVGLASVAVLIGAAVIVYAAPWDPPPTPPATPTPTLEPTPEPTEENAQPPIVALTTAGDLALLHPDTGETLVVAASDPRWSGGISFDPDRTHIYLVAEAPEWKWGTIQRVSLSDGSVEDVAVGVEPSISPDGRTLAYAAPAPGVNLDTPLDAEVTQGVHFLDLASGATRYVPAYPCTECSFSIDQPAWSGNGSRVFASMGMHDGLFPSSGESLLAADAASIADFANAELLGPLYDDPEDESLPLVGWGSPIWVNPFSLAAVVTQCDEICERDGQWLEQAHIRMFDPSSGEVSQRIDVSGLDVIDLTPSPDGTSLAIVARTGTSPTAPPMLYRWDGGEELRLIARDIVAVAW